REAARVGALGRMGRWRGDRQVSEDANRAPAKTAKLKQRGPTGRTPRPYHLGTAQGRRRCNAAAGTEPHSRARRAISLASRLALDAGDGVTAMKDPRPAIPRGTSSRLREVHAPRSVGAAVPAT